METTITTGLKMPSDFAIGTYNEIHQHLSKSSAVGSVTWPEYGSAWNSISYQFVTLDESDKSFTTSVKTHGSGPTQQERYIQERDLFSFFINGLAVLETFCYGMFAIGSFVDSSVFILSTALDKRRVTPDTTSAAFNSKFPNENITSDIASLISSNEFKFWKEIRNILAHRSNPGRDHKVTLGSSTRVEPVTLWRIGIPIDITTTAERRKWLADNLNKLLELAHEFVKRNFPLN